MENEPHTNEMTMIDEHLQDISQNQNPLVFPDKLGSKLLILVDSRETASPITRLLSEKHIDIQLQTLPVGDYIVSRRCGIERKTINDFTDSIKDGRLFDELLRLKAQFSYPILILEGDYHSIITINRAAILGTLTSIVLKLGIFLIQTRDGEDTADFVEALAKKEQKIQENKPYSIRFRKIPEQLGKQLEYIVSGIPGINIARAQDLLREFRTIRNLFMATPEEIRKTPNIGPVLAEKITKYARLDYYNVDQDPSADA